MKFFDDVSKMEKDVFDPFYIAIGLDQGQFKEIIAYLIDEIEQEHEEGELLTQEQREFLNALKKEQAALEQVSQDMNVVQKIDVAFDDALTKLNDQINTCRSHETKAWKTFKEIAKVLNHKKARELYYEMDSLWQNVKAIKGYLDGDFAQHFEKLKASAQQQVQRIKSEVAALKQKGIDLKKELKKLEGDEAPEVYEKKKQKESQKDVVGKSAKTSKKSGFIVSLFSSLFSFFRKIWNYLSSWWR